MSIDADELLHQQAVALYEVLVEEQGDADQIEVSLAELAAKAFGDDVSDRQVKRVWAYLREIGAVDTKGNRFKIAIAHPDDLVQRHEARGEAGAEPVTHEELAAAVHSLSDRITAAIEHIESIRAEIDSLLDEVARLQSEHNEAVAELDEFRGQLGDSPLGDWWDELVGDRLWYYELEEPESGES